MSRLFSKKWDDLVPYVPGEQPKDNIKYIKLNTNESPFPPSAKATAAAAEAAKTLNLYSDPTSSRLRKKLSETYNVDIDNVIVGNGSDELLYFAFKAFCDDETPAVYPETSYGFYPVFSAVNKVPAEEIYLKDDFSIDPEDYINANGTIIIANPNAPTGLSLSVSDIERIIQSKKDNVVIIDEAYVDFGGESCIPFTKKYDNLLVIQTFSKSRSLAGGRLGFAIGNKELISDLNTLRYSFNPYNVNKMTEAAGIGALEDDEYMKANCRTIIENREYTVNELKKLGFDGPKSTANFIFVKHEKVSGAYLYPELKKRGILIRHFNTPALMDYMRISIGTKEQMDVLIKTLADILSEQA